MCIGALTHDTTHFKVHSSPALPLFPLTLSPLFRDLLATCSCVANPTSHASSPTRACVYIDAA